MCVFMLGFCSCTFCIIALYYFAPKTPIINLLLLLASHFIGLSSTIKSNILLLLLLLFFLSGITSVLLWIWGTKNTVDRDSW